MAESHNLGNPHAEKGRATRSVIIVWPSVREEEHAGLRRHLPADWVAPAPRSGEIAAGFEHSVSIYVKVEAYCLTSRAAIARIGPPEPVAGFPSPVPARIRR